ncbi:MAG: glycosyltransferase family 4 protein [Candidatus Krumholzibacteriota bacterium]|nr:glycosyltransferase family 4 protein [Candidatus Krumholzibacteriota bacterium]
MRIAVITREWGKTSGVGRVVADLVDVLAERGHDVTVVTASPPPVSPPPGVRFARVRVPARPFALRVALFARRATRLARAGGFDIVHGNGADCRGADVITAHSCHRYAMDRLRREGPWRDRLKKWLNPVHPVVFRIEAYNNSPRGHRRLIACAAGIKREIVATCGTDPGRIAVVNNGVDLGRFRPENRARDRAALRRRHGLGEEPVLLFMGYEFERKGLRPLLEALARLRRREARLLVVGKPADRWARRLVARHGLAGRVLFTGPVVDAERYFAAADAFVFPTLYEANSLVLLEAFASGLPVVTTRGVGAADDYIRHGENGLLVDAPPAAAALADALDGLLDDPGLAARLGAAARETARSLSREAAAEGVLAVYKDVLAAERAAAEAP